MRLQSLSEWRPIEQPIEEQPGARILPGMAYDADEKKLCSLAATIWRACLNDTWVYDCQKRAWTEVKTAVAPQPRGNVCC
jgi:hypothetical protein